jgi:pimeloyl-ACP methyl ester carboxylesterase
MTEHRRRSAAFGTPAPLGRCGHVVESVPTARESSGEPAVVLLHGQPGSSRDWAGVIARLSRTYRVVAPDRPGYGTHREAARGFDGNVDELVALLDAEGIARAVVVGHSWGAGVALLAALRCPRRIASVVAVTPVVPGELDWNDRVLATPRVGTAAAGLTLAALRALGACARLLGHVGLVDSNLADRLRRSSAGLQIRRGATGMQVEARALANEFGALRNRLPEIQVPTTIVAGTKDRVIRPRALTELAEQLPDVRLVEIPGGHLLPLQAPEAVARVIDSAIHPSSIAA